MLRKDAKMELLAKVPLFDQCSRRELQAIAGVADELNLPAEYALTKEGGTGREFVVIVDGAADVRRRGRKVNSLRSGDFLGEIALVSRSPRTATVTTTEPTRILVITASAFRSLLRQTPSMQTKVMEALAERLPPEFS